MAWNLLTNVNILLTFKIQCLSDGQTHEVNSNIIMETMQTLSVQLNVYWSMGMFLKLREMLNKSPYLLPLGVVMWIGFGRHDGLEPLEEWNEGGRVQVGADTVVVVMATVVPQWQEEGDGSQHVVEAATLHRQLQEKSQRRLLVTHRYPCLASATHLTGNTVQTHKLNGWTSSVILNSFTL